MIEILIIAVFGVTLAGLWDLKTTEVPDPLAIGLCVVGAGYWLIRGFLTSEWYPTTLSIIFGTMLLVLGLILYKKGQWGGADAWILAAVGYLIPVHNGEPFILPYLFNFMIVTIFYTIAYALVIGFLNKHVFVLVAKDIKKHKKTLLIIPAVFLLLTVPAAIYFEKSLTPILSIFVLIVLLLIFWRYALILESKVFKKKILVSKLKTGDVLDKSNWVGLTKKQVAALRKEKKYVTIKDGIRFVPVFAIALVLTLLFGNLFLLLLI